MDHNSQLKSASPTEEGADLTQEHQPWNQIHFLSSKDCSVAHDYSTAPPNPWITASLAWTKTKE